MKLETNDQLKGSYVCIKDEYHACDIQRSLFNLGYNWIDRRYSLRLYTTGYLVLNYCNQMYIELAPPKETKEVYFYKGAFNTEPERQTKTTSKAHKDRLSISSRLLSSALSENELTFVEQEQSQSLIPTVLTSSQIKQIMEASDGTDLRSRCRIVYLLNEKLYNAGVKEI
jgi:hypothetical protein